MKFEQLKKSLNEEIFPIYYLEGEEGFFIEKGLQIIKDKVLFEPQLNYTSFFGEDLKKNIEPLIDSLNCCPFMSEKRVVFVSEWYPTATELKDKGLKKYFDNPIDTTILIIGNNKKCEQLSKIKSVTVVDCGKGDFSLIYKYILKKVEQSKMTISQNVCQKLCEYCLYDMIRIDKEVDKLLCYAYANKEITAEDVEALVNKDSDYKIYEMVSFIADKKYDDAYKIMTELADSDKQMLFTSIYYHFRRMFYVSVSNMTDSELGALLGVKEYAIKMTRAQCSKFTKVRIKTILDKLKECDCSFKSGKITFEGGFLTAIFSILVE